jgi:hypothetical protein
MIDLNALTEATADTFRAIPEVLTILTDPEFVIAFTYTGAAQDKLETAIYQSPAPSILIAWVETLPNDKDTGWWLHHFQYILRGAADASPLDLLTALMNGVPQPGDGQRWRLCGFMAGLEPARIVGIAQRADQEGIDYIEVTAEILETGDA